MEMMVAGHMVRYAVTDDLSVSAVPAVVFSKPMTHSISTEHVPPFPTGFGFVIPSLQSTINKS